MRDDLVIAPAGPDDAAQVHAVALAAFRSRPALDPPSPGDAETESDVRDALSGGGVLARVGGRPDAALRTEHAGQTVWLRRVGVHPDFQGLGLGTRLALWTGAWLARRRLDGDLDAERMAVAVRRELPANRRFWSLLSYDELPPAPDQLPHLVRMGRPLPPAQRIVGPDAMRDVGRRLAALLRPGDVVLLSGDLGAGKTTLTQGVGAGLGVRTAVTSPTFVIARVHPARLPLVHVDAYRVGSVMELDELDLDASLADSVTVVEWGEGLAERLATDRLELRLERGEDDGSRVVVLEAFGGRWRDADLTGVLHADGA